MRRESHVRFWESAGVRFPRATRLVRSIKEECLDRVIPFGERHFRRTLAEFVEHYHRERNHQGLENELIDRVRPVGSPSAGFVGVRGWAGCSNYYDRAA